MSRLRLAGVFTLVTACGSHSTTIGELFSQQAPAGGASTAGGEAATAAVGGAETSGGGAASGGSGAGNPSAGNPSAGNPSAGQDVGSGGQDVASGGQDVASGGAAGGGGVGDSAGAGGAAGCQPPAYPTGPYGVVQGAVVDGSRSFQVYAPGNDALTPIAMSDYFEAAHCSGVRALYIVELEANDATAE